MEMSGVRNNSFQSTLDSIIRNYLLNELPPENDVAERDFGLSRLGLGISLPNVPSVPPGTSSPNPNDNDDHNNNYDNVQYPGISFGVAANGRNNDHEYIKALHKCFEKRGVFKELQTFLRHKLVSILQDERPNLQKPVRSGDGANTIVLRLVEDFLRCHRLLYTLSVLASESDAGQQHTRAQYGKLSSREAEDLLDEMGISRDTRLSSQILKCYFDKENFSMPESLHYLGVWLDGPVATNNLLQESNDMELHGKKKGNAMFLSKDDPTRKNNKTRNGPDSLEKRLYELERSMEMEKDMKIKEAIVKFKSEEEGKIRKELESKFKVDLMEKEREHLVITQKKVDDLTSGMERERQEWLEVKAKQESEILKLRKQVNDVMSAMITIKSANAKAPLVESRSELLMYDVNKQKQKTESIPLVVHYQCDCCKQKESSTVAAAATSSNNLDECNTIYTRKKPSFSQESVQIQHDRMSFLQYRMEHQEEEIKGLHRQLLLSASNTTSHPKPLQSAVLMHHHDHTQPNQSHYDEESNYREDDLESFLKQSKQRMEKLEKVATEVDVKMQTILIANKKRASTPLSSELSARASSIMWNKKVIPSTYHHQHHLSQPFYLLPPQINLPSPRYLEEIQPTFTSSVRQNLPSFNNDLPSTSSRPFEPGPVLVTERKPSTSGQVLFNVGRNQSVALTEENEPATPKNRMFPVAYGTQEQKKQQLPKTSSNGGFNDGRDPDISPKRKEPKNALAAPMVVDEVVEPQEEAQEEAQEESLFHMAIREKPVESKSFGRNLKQKAMLHGALFKEKVSSSDEGENGESRNSSLSESISKAITKSKVSKEEDDHFPMKMKVTKKTGKGSAEENVNGRRKQSVIISGPSAIVPKINSASSSSSSLSKKSVEKQRQQLPQQKYSSTSQGQNKRASPPRVDDDDAVDLMSSLSISAPKSENDEEINEDFWQL